MIVECSFELGEFEAEEFFHRSHSNVTSKLEFRHEREFIPFAQWPPK